MIAASKAKLTSRSKGQPSLSARDVEHFKQFEKALDLIRDRTEQVARRYQNSVFVFGRTGTSKTYTVEDTLTRQQVPWHLWNARISPMGLWCLMRERAEDVIVVDDVATLFASSNKAALQVLLAALNGRPGEGRQVTYATKEDRISFTFHGGVIAIGNSLPKRDPMADALVSRTRVLEHEPADEQLAAFMRAKSLNGYKDVAPAEAVAVTEFVIHAARNAEYRLNLRYMAAGWEDYRYWKSGRSRHDWQTLVKSSMKQIFEDRQVRPVGRADRKRVEQEIALSLFKRFPQPEAKNQRDEQWHTLTGKTPHSLYRRRRELEELGEL